MYVYIYIYIYIYNSLTYHGSLPSIFRTNENENKTKHKKEDATSVQYNDFEALVILVINDKGEMISGNAFANTVTTTGGSSGGTGGSRESSGGSLLHQFHSVSSTPSASRVHSDMDQVRVVGISPHGANPIVFRVGRSADAENTILDSDFALLLQSKRIYTFDATSVLTFFLHCGLVQHKSAELVANNIYDLKLACWLLNAAEVGRSAQHYILYFSFFL